MFRKFVFLVVACLMMGGNVLGELLYIKEKPIVPEKGKYLVVIAVGVRDVNNTQVLASNPPRYPGLWMYSLKQVKSLKELEGLPEQNIVSVIKIGKVYDVEKEFKKVLKEIEVDKFKSFKLTETKKEKKKKVKKEVKKEVKKVKKEVLSEEEKK